MYMQLKSLAKTQDALNSIKNLGVGTEELSSISQKYSLETLKAAIAQSTLRKEQIKAILAAKDLQGELLETTANELANATSTGVVAASQKAAAASTLGLGTTFKGLGTTIKNTTKAMLAWLAANPAGWLIGIGALIYGAVKLFDALTVSLEEQKEKLQETKEAYEEAKGELQDIENELQNLKSKMEELENTPSLTWAEQEELDRLREITKELQLQKQLRQDEQLKAAEDLYKENKKTFDKEFENFYGNASVSEVKEQLELGNIMIGHLDYDNITDVIAALQYLNEERAKLTDEAELAEYDALYGTFIGDLTDGIKSNGQEYLSSLSDYKQNMLEIASIRELTKDELAFYNYLSSMQKMIYEFYSPDTWNSIEFDSIFDTDGLEKTKEELIAMAKVGALSPEALQAFPKLSAAIKDSELIVEEGSDAFTAFYNEVAALADRQGEIIDNANENPVLLPSLSSSISTLAAQLEPQLSELGKLYNEIFRTDDNGNAIFSLDSVDNAALESIRKSFAEIGEEIGVAFDPAKLDPFFDALTSGDGADEVQRAFNGLATAYLYSTGTLEQLNEETANAITMQLEQMGVANAEEIVTEALRAREEELALSKKYLALEGKELAEATGSEVLAFIAEQAEAGNCGAALALLQLKKLLVNGTFLDTEADINNVMRLAKGAGIAAESLAELITLKAAYEKGIAEGNSNTLAMTVIADRIETLKQDFQSEAGNFTLTPVDFKIPDNDKSSASSPAARQAETDWKSLLDKETDLLEKQLAANVITFQSYTDKRRRIIEDYYRDGKIKAEDYYDALESMYGSHLSLYDRVIGAVTDRIDDEIDKLKDQKEEIEKSYQVKIDAIQAEIDALNKANDARRAQIDLEKAQYEAERAKNQRVSKVYDGGQFIYEADMDAVRSAEDDLADREFQLNISRLETQMDSLKAEMENAARSLDIQVEALEAYKDKWNEISGAYQKQQDRLLAAEIMGTEWERDILNGRLDTLRSFTEQYISLQQAQADAAVNAARIKAEAEAGNAAGGSVGSYDSGNNDNKQKYEVVYEGTAQTVREFKTQWEAQNYAKRMNKGIADDDFMYYVKNDGRKYASGTDSARRGLNLVGEDGTETFIDNDGNVSLVTRPTLIPMEGGEVVKSAEETKAMLDTGNLEPVQSDRMKELLAGIRNFKLSDVDLTKVMPPVSAMLNIPNMDYSHVLSHIGTEHNTVHIDNNNVSINCPNVTNNAGAEYIMKELKRLPLDTIQYIHRRQ